MQAVSFYSDDSPVIGSELQGMIMDVILKDGTLHRYTLPGSTLAYGHTDTISKAMALVWAVHLVVGNELDVLRYCFDKVRSLTTDYGVELGINSVVDMLPAFVKWIRNTPFDVLACDVNKDSRLMPNSLRVGGWSHSCGNIVKEVCVYFPRYPEFLTYLRALCRFSGVRRIADT